MTGYPYIVQGSNVTVVIDNKPHTIAKSHITYDKVVAALKQEEWDTVKNLIEPKKVVVSYGKGNITIDGDKIFWKGVEMHNALTRRMVQMIQEDAKINGLVAFMEKLMENPSKRAINELYGFLEKNALPFTPNGNFLAYKRVENDYLDVHSSTVLNKPAAYMTEDEIKKLPITGAGKRKEVTISLNEANQTVVSMDRQHVEDDQNKTCSDGLHFCSRDYLGHFGGSRIIIVEINPADVVSIPNDYNNSKGRCSKYTIVDEIDKDKADETFKKAVQAKAEKEASKISESDVALIAQVVAKVKQDRVDAVKAAAVAAETKDTGTAN